MSLKQQIISDLTASMKAQDAARTSTLRMVKAALMNREIEKGGELDDEEMSKLLRSLVKQRRDSVEQYEKGGRPELADKEKTEIEVIEAYLPQAASRAEIATPGWRASVQCAGFASIHLANAARYFCMNSLVDSLVKVPLSSNRLAALPM